jgi:hypothetical protein
MATDCTAYFGLALCQSDEPIHADICVTKAIDWQVGYEGETYTPGNHADLMGLLLTLVGDALVRRTIYAIFHAGAFIHRNKAIVFAGPARCGKSTLAFNAWRSGISIIGDDLLIIDDALKVRAFPRVLKPRLGDNQKHQQTASGFIATVNEDRRLFIRREANRFCDYKDRHEVSALYFLSREPVTSINPISRLEVMRNGVLQSLIHGKTNPHCVKFIDQLWQRQRIFGLGIADDDSDGALNRILNIV